MAANVVNSAQITIGKRPISDRRDAARTLPSEPWDVLSILFADNFILLSKSHGVLYIQKMLDLLKA